MTTLIPLLLSLILGLEAQIATIETAQASSPSPAVQPVILTVEEKIRVKALENGFDPDLLAKIAWCESRYENVPNHKYDGENGMYTAYGPFQILKSTALDYSTEDRKIVDNNIEIAMLIFKDRGSQPWNESKFCWSK